MRYSFRFGRTKKHEIPIPDCGGTFVHAMQVRCASRIVYTLHQVPPSFIDTGRGAKSTPYFFSCSLYKDFISSFGFSRPKSSVAWLATIDHCTYLTKIQEVFRRLSFRRAVRACTIRSAVSLLYTRFHMHFQLIHLPQRRRSPVALVADLLWCFSANLPTKTRLQQQCGCAVRSLGTLRCVFSKEDQYGSLPRVETPAETGVHSMR